MTAAPAFREVVVPCDGSELSQVAIPFAAEIARRAGGRITLVRAMPEPAIVTDIPRKLLAEIRGRELRELEEAAKLVEGAPVETRLKAGFPAEVTLEASRGKDLIVMTTHGRGGLSRLVLGSNAEKLMRLTRIPILIIRPRRAASIAAAARAAARMFRDVVVPLDRSDLALDAVRPLAALPDRDTRLHVITVVPRGADDATLDAATNYLAARAAALDARGLPALTRLLEHDSPAEAIGAYAESHDCGVVVMSTHGAGGLREWMLGSVTDQVIRRGPVPVLVVPTPRARGK